LAYRVLVAPAGQRDFKRLPPETRDRIRGAIKSLENDPRRNAQKLAAGEGYRIRVGDYRIVFRIDDAADELLVTRIKHRRDVYRRR
jgi:mRNA interferase RelE/StbE